MKISMIGFGPIESKSNGYFIRCYHIARSLTELNHKVLVLEFPEERSPNLTEPEEGIKFVHLQGNEASRNRVSRLLRNVITFDPFHLVKFQLYSLIELIRFRDYVKECDFVIVEGSLIPFGIILPKIFRKKVILDTHCINKLLALHFKNRNFLVHFVRKVLWNLLERFATRKSDIVVVVSEKERDFVHKEYKIPESKLVIIPNVIKVQKRSYSKEELTNLRRKWNLENKIIVTFVGNLESVQNRDAVEYIVKDLAPYFREKRRDVVFLIIGKGNSKCGLQNVIFTGFVENLAPLLEISDMCIAPLRVGSGVKTKVLEYIAYGKPIVSTPLGVEGISLDDSYPVRICKPEDFANHLLEMLENIDSYGEHEHIQAIRELNPELIKRKIKELIKHVQFQ